MIPGTLHLITADKTPYFEKKTRMHFNLTLIFDVAVGEKLLVVIMGSAMKETNLLVKIRRNI